MTRSITGTLVLLPNPCTTRPCLPGMAFAVITGASNTPYFLTKNGEFYMPDSAKSINMPALGDKVVARGDAHKKHDIAGNTFTAIELVAIQPVPAD